MAHFYADLPADLSELTNREAVELYARGAPVPGAAIRGLTAAERTSFPIPGTWSIQQIVLHLMDTDLIASYRMKRIIAEDHPKLDVYDETRFSWELGYQDRDADTACEIFRLNRLMTADLLASLSEHAFTRCALHPEMGMLTLGRLLRIYVKHLAHHMDFLEKKKALLRCGA